jgi:hypothetical protein
VDGAAEIVVGRPIGGYEELWRLEKRGLLEALAA